MNGGAAQWSIKANLKNLLHYDIIHTESLAAQVFAGTSVDVPKAHVFLDGRRKNACAGTHFCL